MYNQRLESRGGFEMSLMDPRHGAIWFNDAKELDMVLARSYKLFLGINFKIFRWRLGFNTKVDPSFIPVWVEIPYLKYDFSPPFLKAIGNWVVLSYGCSNIQKILHGEGNNMRGNGYERTPPGGNFS